MSGAIPPVTICVYRTQRDGFIFAGNIQLLKIISPYTSAYTHTHTHTHTRAREQIIIACDCLNKAVFKLTLYGIFIGHVDC